MTRPEHVPPRAPASADSGTSRRADRNGHAASRREDVVRHAAELFDARGYHAASMEDIAAAVGLRKPTLYHYFGSKDEILYSVHDEFIELLIRRHERRLGAALGPEQQVLEVMGDILELMETHHGHVRVFFEHWRELPVDQRRAIGVKRTRYEQFVRASIQQGIDDGVFRPLDAQLATLAVFGVCNWAYQWYRSDGELRSREIAYAFWDVLMHGMSAAPAPPAP